MRKSIDRMKNGNGSRQAATPFFTVSMSLQPSIPWRVALQQSSPPLPRPRLIVSLLTSFVDQISANGNCVFFYLSQARGSPHKSGKTFCQDRQVTGHDFSRAVRTIYKSGFWLLHSWL